MPRCSSLCSACVADCEGGRRAHSENNTASASTRVRVVRVRVVVVRVVRSWVIVGAAAVAAVSVASTVSVTSTVSVRHCVRRRVLESRESSLLVGRLLSILLCKNQFERKTNPASSAHMVSVLPAGAEQFWDGWAWGLEVAVRQGVGEEG